MEWQYTIYAYPTVFAAVASAIIFVYTLDFMRQRGQSPVALSFAALAVATTLWTGTTVVKLLAVDAGVKLLAYKVLHIGGTFAPPAFLLFALAYTDRKQYLNRKTVGAIFVVPSVFVLVLFTNPMELAYTGWDLSTTANGVRTLSVEDGPVSTLTFIYVFAALFTAFSVIGHHAIRLRKPFSLQAALLLTGMVAPTVIAVFEFTDTPPLAGGVNLVPASLAIPTMLYAIAVFRYKLLDILPIAYAAAGEHSTDGFIVLDSSETVVHTNDTAGNLLGTRRPLRGNAAADVIPAYDQLKRSDEPLDCQVQQAPNRYVELTRIPLEQSYGRVGWVITVRDVTPRKQYELSLESRNDELEMLNRIVRHDIRNDMQIVTAYIELAMEDGLVEPDGRPYLQTALTRAQNTVELTDALGQLTKVTNEDERLYSVDVGTVVSKVADSVRESHPEATITVASLPAAAILGNDLLESVFVNIIENAIVHNDADDPAVDVGLSVTEDVATVRIGDNGPGIPDDKKKEVFGKGEKGLESPGTGVGLYLVDAIVTTYGGKVWVEDNDPRGARFMVELPLA
ncbi:PAS domain S-box protein [Haloferax larsenii]|uniref:histidine kinase n=1 Tax=Haloferax larsenii TaxID=302484 RepID=A0ABY5RB94_HALLR|nr:histidine kinase N-terminal 7TM domain-containing protein [Haloferax larsenii]UVE49617.1 PAS domain S-box protein [Haloferax larsenii]